MVSDFPPLHPAVVHFPIALLLLTSLFGFISIFVKRDFWKDITLKTLIAGVIFAPIAVVTGLVAEADMKHGGIDKMLMLHKYNGVAILFFFQIMLVWYWLRKLLMKSTEYKFWVLCLVFGGCLVMLQGYLGGELVFTKGMGVKPVEEGMESGGHDGGSKQNEGHHNMDNTNKMKDMENSDEAGNMDNMNGKEGMEDMEGMKGMKGTGHMKGMNMKSSLDTFKFEDNNPARKAKKNKY
ncbi:MAG: DUF2231 domain-containing protein [Bacteroidia bacterium]